MGHVVRTGKAIGCRNYSCDTTDVRGRFSGNTNACEFSVPEGKLNTRRPTGNDSRGDIHNIYERYSVNVVDKYGETQGGVEMGCRV